MSSFSYLFWKTDGEKKRKPPTLSSTLSIYDIINFGPPNLNPISDMHLSFFESEGNKQSSISSKGLNIWQWHKRRL